MRADGHHIFSHPLNPMEIIGRKDGPDLISRIVVVGEPDNHLSQEERRTVEEEVAKMQEDGWEKIDEDLGQFGLDPGQYLWVLKNKGPRREDFTNLAPVPDHLCTDEEATRKMQASIDFLGLNREDLKKLITCFEMMDVDGGGSIDIDEFFDYLDQRRSALGDQIFKFLDKDTSAELDFPEFVQAVSMYCMFGNVELMRFVYALHDEGGQQRVSKKEILEALMLVRAQNPAVLSRGQLRTIIEKCGCLLCLRTKTLCRK